VSWVLALTSTHLGALSGSHTGSSAHADPHVVPLFDLVTVPSSRPCSPWSQRAQPPSRSAVAPALTQALRFQAAPWRRRARWC